MAPECRQPRATTVRLAVPLWAFTTLSPDLHQAESPRPPGARKTRCMHTETKRLTRIALLLGVVALLAGCGGGRGETDLSNASRPIDEEEATICEEAGIEPVEFQVANDALTVVVNTDNDWVDCLTTAQLRTIWEPSSKVKSWKDVDPSFPDEKLSLFGPGTDSGTFDYFTDEINGDEGASRSDYSASEDDNNTVTGVSGEKGGLGYFGFSYFEENRDTLKAVEVDGGDGCVAPSVENAQKGTYKPLARPLFIYVKKESLSRREVAGFLRYILDNEQAIAEASQFVPLTDEQLAKAEKDLDAATGA